MWAQADATRRTGPATHTISVHMQREAAVETRPSTRKHPHSAANHTTPLKAAGVDTAAVRVHDAVRRRRNTPHNTCTCMGHAGAGGTCAKTRRDAVKTRNQADADASALGRDKLHKAPVRPMQRRALSNGHPGRQESPVRCP